MFLFVFTLGAVLPSANVAEDPIIKEIANKETELLAKLKDGNIWTDPAREDQLLAHLKTVKTLKSPAFVPILIDHFDYKVQDNIRKFDLKRIEDGSPAIGALTEIGLPAVPALINLLKRDALSDPKALTPSQRTLVIYCLSTIYDRGGFGTHLGQRELAGFGTELARKRIELEISKATGKEKAALERVLKHSLFKK